MMLAICCYAAVTASSISELTDDRIQQLENKIDALTSELSDTKSSLAETRKYLGKSLQALSEGSKDRIDTPSHIITKRDAQEPGEGDSHDDVLSSLSLHDLMPLLSIRCRDGRDGKDGINGIGINGLPGKDGINGLPGKDGINGLPGKDGVNGKDGREGKDGRDGLPGPRGDDGPAGNPGLPGAQGLPGLRGTPGIHGNATRGRDGLPGIPGRDGETGPAGANGAPGVPGSPGSAGLPGVPGNSSEVGSVYTRWGRTTCSAGSTLLYQGVAAGGDFNTIGNGVNYQCLHPDPEYNNYHTGGGSYSIISGVEYESSSYGIFSSSTNEQNVPCARCYTSRSAVVMIPARRTCPSGWTSEYEGYLMSAHQGHKHEATYECVDQSPEHVEGHSGNTNGALFYFVIPDCVSTGTIGHCPPYAGNRQLTCVVCSK